MKVVIKASINRTFFQSSLHYIFFKLFETIGSKVSQGWRKKKIQSKISEFFFQPRIFYFQKSSEFVFQDDDHQKFESKGFAILSRGSRSQNLNGCSFFYLMQSLPSWKIWMDSEMDMSHWRSTFAGTLRVTWVVPKRQLSLKRWTDPWEEKPQVAQHPSRLEFSISASD